jgi:hypothetical protein
MKKFLVVLLILAAAGGLFAQGLAVTGYVDTGVGIFFLEDADDTYAAPVSRDAGQAGVRGQVNGAYLNEEKTVGLNFRIRSNPGLGQQNTASKDNIWFEYYYGFLTGFNGKATIYGGKIDNGAFNTKEAIFDGDAGEDVGLLGIVNPIDTLSLGVGLYTGNPGVASKLEDAKFTLNGAFTLPNVAGFVLTYRNDSALNPKDSQFTFGVNVTAIDKVTIALAAVGNKLQDYSNDGTLRFFETFGYSGIENVSLNLSLWEGISNVENSDLSLRVWLWGSYSLLSGKIVPRLDVNYLSAGKWSSISNIHFDDQFAPTYNKDQVLLNIRPSVGFRVNSNAWLEVGYLLNVDLGDDAKDPVTGKYLNVASGASSFGSNSAIYADVKVSF